MNNQQTLPPQFSVKVGKGDFLAKAKEAYEQCSKLSKRSLEKSITCNTIGELSHKYTESYLNYKLLSKRVMDIISMVSMSSDEFVNVTEDVYKLIYRYDTNTLLLHS